MQQNINNFIHSLSQIPSTKTAFNQYGGGDPSNAIRRNNLKLYLSEMAEIRPRVLLLGEAPGYQGWRLSGVPFTSEDIMLRGIPELGLFGREKAYSKTQEFDRVRKEPTATVVWETLAYYKFVPLLWSAFPFHPHKEGDPMSNRLPTKFELDQGKPIFQELIKMFSIEEVVAVGNIAHLSLAAAGMDVTKIRHPSHGGKPGFALGIAGLQFSDQGTP
jgi:uracil-DNA glycosylase